MEIFQASDSAGPYVCVSCEFFSFFPLPRLRNPPQHNSGARGEGFCNLLNIFWLSGFFFPGRERGQNACISCNERVLKTAVVVVANSGGGNGLRTSLVYYSTYNRQKTKAIFKFAKILIDIFSMISCAIERGVGSRQRNQWRVALFPDFKMRDPQEETIQSSSANFHPSQELGQSPGKHLQSANTHMGACMERERGYLLNGTNKRAKSVISEHSSEMCVCSWRDREREREANKGRGVGGGVRSVCCMCLAK